jgi:hypothetical protein
MGGWGMGYITLKFPLPHARLRCTSHVTFNHQYPVHLDSATFFCALLDTSSGLTKLDYMCAPWTFPSYTRPHPQLFSWRVTGNVMALQLVSLLKRSLLLIWVSLHYWRSKGARFHAELPGERPWLAFRHAGGPSFPDPSCSKIRDRSRPNSWRWRRETRESELS